MARTAPAPFGSGEATWNASEEEAWPKNSAWIRAPRARAMSNLSRTTIPAPSLNIKPSRSLSNGRLARSGQWLNFVGRALMAAKPAMDPS